jgi:arylsulfatase A-like enzyme
VPLLIYDPRRLTNKKGLKSEGIALNIDIAPTILSYAGIDVPKGMQGRDLRKLVDENPADWRTDFFYEHLFEYRGRIPRSECMVSKDWKYLVYIDQQPPYEQLFDLYNDPHEVNNLAAEGAYADQLNLMKNRYSELKKEAE